MTRIRALLFDICTHSVYIDNLIRVGDGDIYVSPRQQIILVLPDKPYVNTLYVEGKDRGGVVVGYGCGTIYTTTDLGEALNLLNVTEVVLGDKQLSTSSVENLESLLTYLTELMKDVRAGNKRVFFLNRLAPIKFMLGMKDPIVTFGAIARMFSAMRVVESTLRDHLRQIVQQTSLAGRIGAGVNWNQVILYLIAFGIIALAMVGLGIIPLG
ncbi:MAG: hypothetical protein QW680_05780 [Pyrobaculum sp.]